MTSLPFQIVELARVGLAGPLVAMDVARRTAVTVAADDRGEIGVWDPTGQRLLASRLPRAPRSLAISPDGATIAVITGDGELLLLDARLHEIARHPVGPADGLRFGPRGARLLVFERASGRAERLDMRTMRSRVLALPVGLADAAPLLDSVVVSTRDGSLVAVNLRGEVVFAASQRMPLGALAVEPSGAFAAVAALAHGALGFDPRHGTSLGRFDLGLPVRALAVSREAVALGSTDGTVVLTDRVGKPRAWTRLRSAIRDLWSDEDCFQVIAWLDDGSAAVLRVLPEHVDATSIECSAGPGGAGSVGGLLPDLRVASVAARKALAIAPDGRSVVAPLTSRALALVSVQGEVLYRRQLEGTLHGAAFGASGACVVTDRAVYRVDADGLEPAVDAHPHAVVAAALSHDGTLVALADETGAFAWREVQGWRELARSESPPDDRVIGVRVAGLRAVALTRSGRTLLVAPSGVTDVASPVDRPGEPRLLAVTVLGPIVLRAGRLHALDWEGESRWARGLPGRVVQVTPLTDGSVRVHAGRFVERIDARGSLVSRHAAGVGRVLAVAGGRATGLRLLEHDGRRLSLLDGEESRIWHHTFDAPVDAAVLSVDGRRVAAVVSGRLHALDVHVVGERGHDAAPIAERTRLR